MNRGQHKKRTFEDKLAYPPSCGKRQSDLAML